MYSGQVDGDVDQKVRNRFFRAAPAGVFVEVGAARPDFLSIGALYRSLGWTVLAIDPNPAYAELHQRAGQELLQYACADHDEDGVDFVVVDSHGATYGGGNVSYESFSSLAIKPKYAALKPNLDARTIKVDLRRLDTILANHAPSVAAIDILSVDVEGWEIEVLEGLSFPHFRPGVVIIENLFREPSYRRYMMARGYLLWRHPHPNEVWVRGDMLGLGERLRSHMTTSTLQMISRLSRRIDQLTGLQGI